MKQLWSVDTSSAKHFSKRVPSNYNDGDKHLKTIDEILTGSSASIKPLNPEYYYPEELCEKVPFVSNNCTIYPLSGNLRGDITSVFLNSGNLHKRIGERGIEEDETGSVNGAVIYTSATFGNAVGSHWEGSFSISGKNKNGNLIGDPFEGFSNNYSGKNLFSVLHDYDRISFNHRVGEASASWSYSRTFTEIGDHCFSFYVKSSTPIDLEISSAPTSRIASEKDIISDNKIHVPSHYVRIGFIGSDNFTVSFTASTSNVCQLDFCGLCYSEGKTPIEIDYRNDGRKRPLALNLGLGNTWTIKYKRYVFSNEEKVFYDWIGGICIPYPIFPNETEIVTVKRNGDDFLYRVIAQSGKNDFTSDGILTDNVTGSMGNPSSDSGIDISLGGRMVNGNFVSYPGIYRDLLVFKGSDLDEEETDNSLLAVTFDTKSGSPTEGKTYMRSSLFKEVLQEVN